MTDEEILRLAAKHYHVATDGKPMPDYGRWTYWAERMRDLVGTFRTPVDALHYAQDLKLLPFSHRGSYDSYLFLACSQIMNNDFPWFAEKIIDEMSDNPASLPGTMGRWFNGAKGAVSNVMLWHTWSIFTCQTHVSNIRSVVDIGGGFGEMARLWCLYFPVERYVIVDIPETLYFAEACLRPIFGEDVGYLIDDVPKTKIVLVPVDSLEKYRERSDLVISIGSMQEMSDYWVGHYMDWLDGYDTDFFYSLNYVAQSAYRMEESRCLIGPHPSPSWSTVLLSLDPAVIRMMTYSRHFLAALYWRKPARDSLASWSVLRGDRALTTATYVEGLDLLRQCPTRENIDIFVDTVGSKAWGEILRPKELMALAFQAETERASLIREYMKNLTMEMRQ